MHDLVNKLQRQNAVLSLAVDSYDERPDIAPRAVFIEGNEDGFRSLAEIIALYLNELEDVVLISALPMVSSSIAKPFAIRFSYGDQIGQITQGLVVETVEHLEWRLTETEASVVATTLHGIGYAYEHVHFDPTPGESDYAVYCGRDE